MFYDHLDCFQKLPNPNPGDHGTLNAHKHCLILSYLVWGLAWIEIYRNSIWLRNRSHMTSHYTWGSVTTHLILKVCWDSLYTLSFGLSQFHGHGSWLVCEVALSLLIKVYSLCRMKQQPDEICVGPWQPNMGASSLVWCDACTRHTGDGYDIDTIS